MKAYKRIKAVHQMTMGMDVAGREFLSLVIKATYDFPDKAGGILTPAEEQAQLVMADTFTGDPGYSATMWETDFAFRKARCDVVVQGAAYAPGGKPAERVPVGLRVGGWQKSFHVVGHREWQVLGPSIGSTRPHPFTRAEFGYHTAFGGMDRLNPDDQTPPAYAANPAGQGFASFRNQSRLSGQPLPNTEVPGEAVTSPYEEYAPMALGPISRAHPERRKYAGTYDQNWEDNVFPFLPSDFDERYYQQVGTDQQIDPPGPGTEVVLLNLTPQGKETFRLPDTNLPVTVFRNEWEVALETAVRPDTLLFDTEARQASLVWRVEAPIKRIITEFTEAWIGKPRPGMVLAKQKGKTYQDFVLPEDADAVA